MERIRILVADDSTPIQKVIRIAFSKHPVEIDCIGSLTEGIQAARRSNPDLIIFDAALPGSKAVQDFKELTQQGRIPAIALLGSYDSLSRDDLVQGGFTKVLKKPFDSKELIAFAEKLVPGFPSVTSNPPTPLAQTQAPQMTQPAAPPPPPPKSSKMEVPAFTLPDPPPAVKTRPAPPPEPPRGTSAEKDIESLVEERVLAYCRQHFSSLAREVITAELRRLADEKTRHLSDS